MDKVTLEIPENLSYQLVFRQVRTGPFGDPPRPDADFSWVGTLTDGLLGLKPVARVSGVAALPKTLLKLATGRRFLYLVTLNGAVAHAGWVTVGSCRFYRVEPVAAVIGPIRTEPAFRRRGLATHALRRALDALLERGISTVYIDTAWNNAGSRKAIEGAGFGAPLAAYIRGPRLPEDSANGAAE